MHSLKDADLTNGNKKQCEPSQHCEHRKTIQEREREGGRERGGGVKRERREGEEVEIYCAHSKAITTYFSFLVLPSPKIRLST